MSNGASTAMAAGLVLTGVVCISCRGRMRGAHGLPSTMVLLDFCLAAAAIQRGVQLLGSKQHRSTMQALQTV